jgi:hypothetical protein
MCVFPFCYRVRTRPCAYDRPCLCSGCRAAGAPPKPAVMPQFATIPLRFACRCRRRDGLTLFRMSFRARRTFPIRRRFVVHSGQSTKATPHRVPFWFKRVSTFGLLLVTTFIGSSHMLVVPAHPLLLSAFVRADSASSRFGVPVARRLRCPRSFTPTCYRLSISR